MFSTKKKFFKQLEPSTILHQHFWLGHSHWFMLFEFGHFDDDTGYVYWQRAKVKFQDNMVFVDTADINNDRKVYEQMELGKISDIGIVRKAMQNEIIFFEEHLDEYLVKLWFNGVINKNNVIIGNYLDGRLTMLKLAAEPPVYTYARIMGEQPEDVFIFKTAPLCYDNGKLIINAKEMLLMNDEVRLIEPDKTMMVCFYSEVTAIREATDSEIELLLIKADDKKKNTTVSDKLFFSDLFLIEFGSMMYASSCSRSYVFPFKGYTKDGENAILHYDSCLIIREPNIKYFINGDDYVKQIDYNSIKILRFANDYEISLYNEREYSFMHKTSEPMSFEKALKPFSTKVLVSDGQGDIWRPAIFGCIVDDDVQRYMIVGGQKFRHCVLYKQFRNLLGMKFEKVPDTV